jgi:hypothetical protein
VRRILSFDEQALSTCKAKVNQFGLRDKASFRRPECWPGAREPDWPPGPTATASEIGRRGIGLAKIPHADPRPMLGRTRSTQTQSKPHICRNRVEIVRCHRGRCGSRHAAKPYLLKSHKRLYPRPSRLIYRSFHALGHLFVFGAKQSAGFGWVILIRSLDVKDKLLIIHGDMRLDHTVVAEIIGALAKDWLAFVLIDKIKQVIFDVGSRGVQ